MGIGLQLRHALAHRRRRRHHGGFVLEVECDAADVRLVGDVGRQHLQGDGKAQLTRQLAGMVRIARFGESLIRDAVDPDREIDYVRVQQTSAPSSGMGRRVYTGMVPDFGSGGDTEGMLLSDVRPGGPAEEAGLQGGDVVVEFAGKSIASLQDYSDALRGAKLGETVTIVITRDGERQELTITPEARKQ